MSVNPSASRAPLRIIVLGAASGIAEATARLYAAEGAHILLVGRREDRLRAIADDLRARGAGKVEQAALDLVAVDDYPGTFEALAARLGGVDHVLLTYGLLGDQATAEKDWRHAEAIIDANYRSAAGWTLAAFRHLEALGKGSLVVLGSVAGDRGRRANFVYGSAKAGIATLVEGIAHRVAGERHQRLRVVVIKPGPTDTAMTAGMAKSGPLWSNRETVAAIVRRAADRGGPVIYAPWFWRYIMLIIRLVPAAIFNRLNI